MNGMPLYDYARKGIPLPRPIEQRGVTVHSLELVEWHGSSHAYRWPEKKFTDEERAALEKALRGVDTAANVADDPRTEQPAGEGDGGSAAAAPTAFVLKMRVSGGTYVRSIVHDLGHAVGSAAHVVTLQRSRQSRFALAPADDGDRACVPWDVFARAAADKGAPDADGWYAWESAVMAAMEVVDGGGKGGGAAASGAERSEPAGSGLASSSTVAVSAADEVSVAVADEASRSEPIDSAV